MEIFEFIRTWFADRRFLKTVSAIDLQILKKCYTIFEEFADITDTDFRKDVLILKSKNRSLHVEPYSVTSCVFVRILSGDDGYKTCIACNEHTTLFKSFTSLLDQCNSQASERSSRKLYDALGDFHNTLKTSAKIPSEWKKVPPKRRKS